MSKDSMNRVNKEAARKQVALRAIGDAAVSEAEIEQSMLYRDLTSLGLPVEIGRVMGLHDIQTALAIQSLTRTTAGLIDYVRAELLIAIFKAEMRARNESDEAIEAATAAMVARIPALPIIQSTPGVALPPSAAEPPSLTATALTEIKAGQPVSFDLASGRYYPSDRSTKENADAMGVALDGVAAGGTFRVALPGALLPIALVSPLIASLTGDIAYVGQFAGTYDGPPRIFPSWQKAILQLVSGPKTGASPNWTGAIVIDGPLIERPAMVILS